MKLLASLILISNVAAAQPFLSAKDDQWNNGFTKMVNSNAYRIALSIQSQEGIACTELQTGTCFGFYEETRIDQGIKDVRYSGVCNISGNRCTASSDTSWQVMVEGTDQKMEVIRVISTERKN